MTILSSKHSSGFFHFLCSVLVECLIILRIRNLLPRVWNWYKIINNITIIGLLPPWFLVLSSWDVSSRPGQGHQYYKGLVLSKAWLYQATLYKVRSADCSGASWNWAWIGIEDNTGISLYSSLFISYYVTHMLLGSLGGYWWLVHHHIISLVLYNIINILIWPDRGSPWAKYSLWNSNSPKNRREL